MDTYRVSHKVLPVLRDLLFTVRLWILTRSVIRSCKVGGICCLLWDWILTGSVIRSCQFCLFVLRLNVPVNNFSVMSGQTTASWVINQYIRGVKCLAQGHNTAAVGIEPPTSRSGVRHSTTEPPHSPLASFEGPVVYCETTDTYRVSHKALPGWRDVLFTVKLWILTGTVIRSCQVGGTCCLLWDYGYLPGQS